MGYGLLDGRIEVRARVARQSYGWVYRQYPFIPGIHETQDKQWDDLRGAYVADNQMHWIIKRGQLVQLQDSGTTSWHNKFDTSTTGVKTGGLRIYTHHGHEPPQRRDASLCHLVNLIVDTPVPVEELKLVSRRADNGEQKEYYTFEYDAHFEVSGASVDISLIHGGRTLATKYLTLRSE